MEQKEEEEEEVLQGEDGEESVKTKEGKEKENIVGISGPHCSRAPGGSDMK